MTNMTQKHGKIGEIIEQVREENGRPMLHIIMQSISGGKAVSAYARGKEVSLDAYARNGGMKLHLKYESIGDNGLIHYHEDGISFSTRFGGEVHNLFIPYACVIGLELDNGDIFDLRHSITPGDKSLFLAPILIRSIVEFMDSKYPGIPVIAGIGEIGSETIYARLTPSSFGEDNTLHFGDTGDWWIIELPEDLTVTKMKANANGEELDVVFTHLFCPPECSPFVTQSGQVAIIDPELQRHLTAVVEKYSPETMVQLDLPSGDTVVIGTPEKGSVLESTVDSSPMLFGVDAKVVEEMGVVERPGVGETTYVGSGNVVAVDFRSRKVLK